MKDLLVTPEEQFEKKKNRARIGLAIGLMLGIWTAFDSYGTVIMESWILQAVSACVLMPVAFALIGGGPKGLAAVFGR